ncbi:hypothetical protein OUZ56_024262 [Daphnia magna]|uniref:GMP synthase n=1 Tax=Daphnia magna TaxID=35525 RepID=A0ABR0B0G7_9CRUS|nr:hypothetical protein OUZ56_024262 [Daphnia magna]
MISITKITSRSKPRIDSDSADAVVRLAFSTATTCNREGLWLKETEGVVAPTSPCDCCEIQKREGQALIHAAYTEVTKAISQNCVNIY